MGFVANFLPFPAVQTFWKSVKIWQVTENSKVGTFLRHSVYPLFIISKLYLSFCVLFCCSPVVATVIGRRQTRCWRYSVQCCVRSTGERFSFWISKPPTANHNQRTVENLISTFMTTSYLIFGYRAAYNIYYKYQVT